MEKLFQEFSSASWSLKNYTPSELAKMGSFPMVVQVSSSGLGDNFYEDYSNNQVLYLHGVKEQFRFLADDEEGNTIGIPINTHINLLNKEQDMFLEKEMQLPMKVKTRFRSRRGIPELHKEYDDVFLNIKYRGWMKYLVGACISKESVAKYIECIPVNYSNISFKVALYIGDGDDDQLTKFEACLHDEVQSIIPDTEFNQYQGNPEIIVNAQQNLIKIQEDSTYTPHIENDSATYENDDPLLSKKEDPQLSIISLKSQQNYTQINVQSDAYENLKGTHSLGKPSLMGAQNFGHPSKEHQWLEQPPLPDAEKSKLAKEMVHSYRQTNQDNKPELFPPIYSRATKPMIPHLGGDFGKTAKKESQKLDDYFQVDGSQIKVLEGYCVPTPPNQIDQSMSHLSEHNYGIANDDYDTLILDETVECRSSPKLPLRNKDKTSSASIYKSTVEKISETTFKLKNIISKSHQNQEKISKEYKKIRGIKDLPEDLSEMTCHQVQDCLELLKLEKHQKVFKKYGIDGKLLLDLDRKIMEKELNFTDLEILKLEKFIETKWLPSY